MKKKIDAIFSETIVGIIDKLNSLEIEREDIVNILETKQGHYIAIFYS